MAIESVFQQFQLGLHVGIMKYMAKSLALKIGTEQNDPSQTVKLHYDGFMNTDLGTLIKDGVFDKDFFGDWSLDTNLLFKDVVAKALKEASSKVLQDMAVKSSIGDADDVKI